MFFEQSSPLLTRHNVEVSSKGELVVLRFGNVDLPMHYEHAMSVSRWIREEARAVKGMTGRGKTSRTLGTLVDLNAKAKPLAYAPGVAIHAKTRLCEWHRGDVWAEGRLVCIKIGNTTIRLHFESVLKLSQWLRLRAKEARNRAGDTRHWSAIAYLDGLEG